MSTPVRIGRVSSRDAARPGFAQSLDERSPPDGDRAIAIEGRCLREVRRGPCVQGELRPTGADLDGCLAGLDHDFLMREIAHDVAEQPRRHDDLSLSLDGCAEVRLDRELHVGGEEIETTLARLEKDAREHGKRAARGHPA